MSVEENFKKIREEIDSISNGVKILVAIKGREVELVNRLIRFGVKNIGENYLSEAVLKFPFLEGNVRKHFIGPIQSNKVKKIVENFDVIGSLSRLKIACLIDKFACKFGKVMPVFVQVNVSGEDSKEGVFLWEVEGFIHKLQLLKNIKVVGLMSIGSIGNKLEFIQMKKLFDYLNGRGNGLIDLSMGMSGDYMEAVREGGTVVRIGSKIFE